MREGNTWGMNTATIISICTVGMLILSIVLTAIGLYETFHRSKKTVEQLATLPPQSPSIEEAIPFQPDEALASEIFAEIVSWQVSDVLSACHWYDNDREVR